MIILVSRWAALAVLLAAAVGCDAGYTVRGTVKSAADICHKDEVDGSVYDGVKPLAGAAVTLNCPYNDYEPYELAKTDEQGRFRHDRVGAMSEKCEVRVSKEGFHTQVFSVKKLCSAVFTGFGEGSCQGLTVYAELMVK